MKDSHSLSKNKDNEGLRIRSGQRNGNNKLQAFLYDLLRDHLTAGTVESIIRDAETISSENTEVLYTNGWLADYADDLARRLTDDK